MPIAALAPMIIGGAIGGGLLAKKASGGSSSPSSMAPSANSPLDPSIIALNQSLKSLADFQIGQGQQLLPKATGTLQGPQNFYETLLKGDREAMMSLLGPQLNAIGKQGQAQQRTLTELMPRSGAMTDRLGALSTNTQGQINDALLQYRPAAAQSLVGIGNTYANIGSGLLGGGGNNLSSGLGSLLGQRGQDINAYLAQYAQKQENSRSLGQGIGSILGLLIGPGGILNRP